SAKAQPFSFHNVNTSDGLSENNVRSVAIDKNGYLWIGTVDGLNVYDGYAVTSFKKEQPGDCIQQCHPSDLRQQEPAMARHSRWNNMDGRKQEFSPGGIAGYGFQIWEQDNNGHKSSRSCLIYQSRTVFLQRRHKKMGTVG